MKISKREMVLGSMTLAAVLAGITWVLVDRKTEEWKAMAGRIEQEGQQIRLYQAAIRMEESWRDELTDLQAGLRVFDTEQRSVSPDLMKTIKALSNRYDLDITRSQPYDEKPTGSLFELGINCTWQGSLDALVGFLTELQQQGVSYDVRQLNVTPAGKDTGLLKGNMVIHCAYTRRPKADEPEVPEETSGEPEAAEENEVDGAAEQ